MRILFIAMANSIHTARWIDQLAGRGWDIHLFPVESGRLHPDLKNLTIHDFLPHKPYGPNHGLRLAGAWPFPGGATLARHIMKRLMPSWSDRVRRLARTISKLKPDIVHSLEMQHAGYLTLDAKNHLDGKFPPWIFTPWGSDIYLFGRLSEHARKIKDVLSSCNYYAGECHRDVKLARAFGFDGEVLMISPVTGGFNTEQLWLFRQPGPTSARRLILLKGYQNWAGRALVGLQAIRLSADVLKGYRIAVYLANQDVRIAAELLSQSTGIPIEIVPRSSHDEMLRLHGRARVSIGLSISDGISVSMLEAMVMGSFPVQSNTSCGNEWIRDGETGRLVFPEDPENVAGAIRLAVTDDALVDSASDINARLTAERANESLIKPEVVNMYKKVFSRGKSQYVVK